MVLSWNEIKTRASAFIQEWKDIAPKAREEADAQTFENGFFQIFGVTRSQIAIFDSLINSFFITYLNMQSFMILCFQNLFNM
jgi:hypothetical protein